MVGPDRAAAATSARRCSRPRARNAVRIFVVFRDDPYDAAAIARSPALEQRMPAVAVPARGCALRPSSWSGATPTAADAVAATDADIWRVALLAALLMSLVLMLYFRAVLAPLLLIASSALGLAASLGVFVAVFQGPLGYPDVTFFVPVTAGSPAGLARRRLQRVRDGAHLGGGTRLATWPPPVQAALPRASRAVSIAAADPGRELCGPRARSGPALPRARVHHGRGSGDRRIPGALVPASGPARARRTARFLAASEAGRRSPSSAGGGVVRD